MPRHNDDTRLKDFTPQADTIRNLLDNINENLDPDSAFLTDDLYRSKLDDGPPPIVTVESGVSQTAAHHFFRLTLSVSPFVDGTFRPIEVEQVRRWQYLRNPLRIAERQAAQKLFEDLHAGRLPWVSEADVLRITSLPPESIDFMIKDGLPFSIAPDGSRRVPGPALLRWLDSLPEKNRRIRPPFNHNGNGHV